MAGRTFTNRGNGLPGHPAQRQRRVAVAQCRRVEVGRGAEVRQLDGESTVDETAVRRQRTVDHTHSLDVLHRGRYLRRHEYQTAVAARTHTDTSTERPFDD